MGQGYGIAMKNDVISILLCVALFYHTSSTFYNEYKVSILHSLYGNIYNEQLDSVKQELPNFSDSLKWYFRLSRKR